MKYQNNLFTEFAKILNHNPNNVKIVFKTNNNLIKYINNKTKLYRISLFFLKMLVYINLNVIVINII
jgi:hypothetical protein